MLYVFIAILLFGFLIAIHEFGHFATAKLFGVKVNEFAIGMGPAIFSRQKGETRYALRAIPIGGFCAMEGEDEESCDPRAFTSQKAWKKVIILGAGAFMNFLAGLLLIWILFSQAQAFTTPVLSGFMDGFPLEGEQGLMVGDRIVEINGERIYLYNDVSTFLARSTGDTMDLVIERDGERIVLDDFPLVPREYVVNGQTVRMYGLYFGAEEATLGVKLRNTWYNAIDFVRLVRLSLVDLFTGNAGVDDLTGPVGVVDTITDVGNQSESFREALDNIIYFGALIAVNLAVMNLLPLPALDGGRIFFLFISSIWTLITRRRIDPKYEGYVHAAGLVLLMGLMLLVTYNDIVRIFTN